MSNLFRKPRNSPRKHYYEICVMPDFDPASRLYGYFWIPDLEAPREYFHFSKRITSKKNWSLVRNDSGKKLLGSRYSRSSNTSHLFSELSSLLEHCLYPSNSLCDYAARTLRMSGTAHIQKCEVPFLQSEVAYSSMAFIRRIP
jgi:hypothetical protein